MDEIKRNARVAGILYLLIAITGPFNLIYVPSKLIAKGNATQTIANILANESLYRIDLAVGMISCILFLFVALALYRLFKDVDQRLAAVMAILVIVQIPQAFVSQMLQFGALELARGADFLSTLDKPQRESLAMLCVHLNAKSSIFSEIYWGIWLFPLGMLVIRSGFLPRVLGYWLLVNGAAYVVLSFGGVLLPQFDDMLNKILFPALFGELAFLLWLVIVGARPRPTARTT